MPQEYQIHSKSKVAQYTGSGWPHSNAYPALVTAVGLFYGCESRANQNKEQINDDMNYHIQVALISEDFGL